MSPESILKKMYNQDLNRQEAKETVKPVYSNRYKGMHCRVCLVKEHTHAIPITIDSSVKVYELVKEELAASDREVMLSILLTVKLHLIGVEEVAIGNLNCCRTYPAEIFKSAIAANAAHIVLCHNHPSGDAEPSLEDIEFTQNIVRCGELLGIKVQDHLIVSNRGYVSLNERGLIRRGKTQPE